MPFRLVRLNRPTHLWPDPSRRLALLALMAPVVPLMLTACGGSNEPEALNLLPSGVAEVSRTAYGASQPGAGTSAATQDLLTGGLGRSGLAAAAAPAYADPLNPTVFELRRNAIHANYRAVLDPTPAGGFGTLYGPNVDAEGRVGTGEGLIPGVEYLARVDDGSGRRNVVVAVQIPANFDPDKPCIVAGPSSGSRGVYGSIGTASEWGLKRRCAVALTDSGKGMGLYDPSDDSVNRIDGTRASRSAAGLLAHFAANIGDAARAAFNAAFPNRLALKHVHSQQNPEKDWGNDTLASIRYALYVLNQEYAPPSITGGSARSIRYTAANTLVIAGSVSNGGAAVLQAAEQDASGLIDGVVAGEPSAQPRSTSGYGVQLGGVPVPRFGAALIDTFTYANIFQPCAALAEGAAMTEPSVFNYMTIAGMNGRAANRCAALAARGLVSGSTLAQQAADALAKLRGYGYGAEHDTMHNAHYGLGNSAIIAMMYTNAFGRFGLEDNLCGMSLAATSATGEVVPVPAASRAASFALGNGTANGSPASVVYNDSVGGARLWSVAVSPGSGLADFALDAALCQRALVTGVDPVSGAALTATSVPTKAASDRVRAGIAEVQLTGQLRGIPTLMVAGRSDALVPINHAARAYLAFNRSVEGAGTKLRYIEVTNAQHFDTFLPLSGFDNRYVPLHVYFNRAMDAMWAHLSSGAALPPSQVVRATPRGGAPGAAPPIAAGNVPPFLANPATADRIEFVGSSVNVPN